VVADESALLARYAGERDAEAFRALVEGHQHMVFAVCNRILGNRADAEDVAQHCFFQLARKASRLRAPIGGWLHRVAVQASIDELRRKTARTKRERKAAQQRAGPAELAWEDIREYVDEAIARLPARLRVPVVLYYLEGKTQEEIAGELGVSQPAISGRLKRGVEALRTRLRKRGVLESGAALGPVLIANAAEAAPSTLTGALGKMALAGIGNTPASATALAAVMVLAVATAIALCVVGIGLGVSRLWGMPPAPGSALVSEDAGPRISSSEAADTMAAAPLTPGQIIERVLAGGSLGQNMLIDFDTGELYSLEGGIGDVDTMIEWMRERGIDALYDGSLDPRCVLGSDMVVFEVPDAVWGDGGNGGLPMKELRRLRSRAFPVRMCLTRHQPATFAFNTREGCIGVVQVLQVGQGASGGAQVRYRLVAARVD